MMPTTPSDITSTATRPTRFLTEETLFIERATRAGIDDAWAEFIKSVDKRSPTYLYTSFIDIFCHPENKLLPCHSVAPGKIEIAKNITLRDVPLEDLQKQIDPRRVRPALLRQLGFSIAKNVKVPEITTKVVEGLISFFEGLEPLPNLRVGKVGANTSPRYRVINKVDSGSLDSNVSNALGLAGSLAHFTSHYRVLEGDKKRTKVDDIFVVVGLHSGLRSTKHQEGGSISEVGKISRIAAGTAAIGEKLWNYGNLDPEDRQFILTDLDLLIENATKTLNAAIVEVKVVARQRISDSSGAIDKRGRRNATGTAMRVNAAAGNLESRLDTIAATSRFNKIDHFALLELAFRSIEIVSAAKASLLKRNFEAQGMFSSRINADNRIKNVDGFFANLGLSAEVRAKLNFRPYSTCMKQVEAVRGEMIKIAGSPELKDGPQTLRTLTSILHWSASLHPTLESAREAMIAPINIGVAKGRLLEYCRLTKLALKDVINGIALMPLKDIEQRLQTVEQALLTWQLPHRSSEKSYFKSLADSIDFEKDLIR